MMNNSDYVEKERELKRERKFLRNIMATIPDSLLILGRELQIKSANRSFYKLFQTEPENVIGRKIADILGDEDGKLSAKLGGLLGTKDTLENFELHHQSEKLGERILSITARGIIVAEEEEEEEEEEELLVLIRDISARKQAEEMLRRTEENFRRSLDESPLGVRMVSAEGETLYANRTILDMYGYDSVEELKMTPRQKSYTPESYAEHQVRKEKRERGEYVPSNYEISIVRKNGEIRHLEVFRKEVLWNGKTQFQVLYNDITERKEAEEKLLYERNLLETLLHNHPDFVYFKDSGARFLRMSKRFCDLFGCGMEDIIGKTDLELFPEEVAKQTYSEDVHIIKTGIPLINKEECAGGTWVLTTKIPWVDKEGNIIGLFGISRDITERKQAEEAIRSSEEKFRSLVHNVKLGIYRSTPGAAGKFLEVNPAMEEITGYSREELLRVNVCDLYLHPEERATVSEEISGTAGAVIRELDLRKKDGMQIVVLMTVSAVRDITGQVLSFDGILEDITERKQAEEALQHSMIRYRELAESIGDVFFAFDRHLRYIYWNRASEELTGISAQDALGKHLYDIFPKDEQTKKAEEAYLKALKGKQPQHFVNEYQLGDKHLFFEISAYPTKDGLSVLVKDITEHKRLEEELQRVEKLESIGTLAGGIAHDFNNILTAILGNITLAERDIEPKGEAAKRLLEAKKASLRAKDLTQQLLTFARGGAPIKEVVSIAELLEESALFTLRGSNVKCEFSLPDDLWSIEVDRGQMSQVITNLVINADEAMPEGGLLDIGAKNTVIKRKRALPLPKGDFVEITVEDHGVGIPKEHLGRIFEPYFTTKQKGTGLGLATVYSIIRNHDGYITVESEPGVGTTFHIYLPASKKPVTKKEEVEEAVQAAFRGRKRILVMDDEGAIRDVLSNMLSTAGFEVELASDGKEAIKRYEKAMELGQPFDAVILDLTVPGGMGGKEAIKKLIEIDPDVKAIVSSGYSIDPIMADFRKYGFSAVMAKPYSIREMERTLRRILVRAKKNHSEE